MIDRLNRGACGLAALLTALSVTACSGHPEEPLLEQFFSASRLRDKTALSHFSTIIFEPSEQGIVTTFEIVGVTEDRPSGKVVSKNVTITAPVKVPDGRTEQKKIVITMGWRDDHWMITGVVVQGLSAAREGR